MKYLLSAVLLLVFGIYLNAQKNTDILYYLPDSVEMKIQQYASKQKTGVKFYCLLRSMGNDTFNLSICQYRESDKKKLERWIFLTKRKVVVDKYNYPLVLDYDYMFSTLSSSRVGVYGDRANKIVRQLPIVHCFNVSFTKFYILDNGKPVGYSNKQQIKD